TPHEWLLGAMPALNRGADSRRILASARLAAAQARVFEAGLIFSLEGLDFCCGKMRENLRRRITTTPPKSDTDAQCLEEIDVVEIAESAAPYPRAALPPRQRGPVRTGPPDRPLDSARQIRDARERQSRGAGWRAGLAPAHQRDRGLPGAVKLRAQTCAP